MEKHYDALIIGGSYAGLSAALCLGRSLRKTLIIDAGRPCNRMTPHTQNFLTHDGRAPDEVRAVARRDVERYPDVSFLEDSVVSVAGGDGAFTVTTQGGPAIETKKLLFATGLEDHLPDIPGVRECWGKSVIHCPYCHGYEYRGQPTGILMNNDTVVYTMARLIGNLTEQLTFFTNGPAEFDAGVLRAQGYGVEERPIGTLHHAGGRLATLELDNGERYDLAALYLHPHVTQKCPAPEQLGCGLTDHGHLVIDEHMQTTVPGIYAAGDCTTMFRSVANAIGQGNVAGAMLHHGLLMA